MKLKRIAATISALLVVLLVSMPASATRGEKTAVLNYSDIKISLDDRMVIPRDVNGNYVEPFAIEGTTYLPVRAIGDAVGLTVGWDQGTSTVILKSGGSPVAATGMVPETGGARNVGAILTYSDIKISLDGKEVLPVTASGQYVEPFAINGTTYLPVRGIASVMGLLVNWDGNTNTVVLTTRGYAVEQSGAHGVAGVPAGWVEYSTGNLSTLLNAAMNGDVIYRNGKYWCSPEYAASIGNENVVDIVDVADGNGSPSDDDVLKPGDQVIPVDDDDWVSPDSLSGVITKIGVDKIMSGQASSAEVSEIEILKYCMPSIPDDFTENPVPGTYDGIRITVDNGKIMLCKEDLEAKGLI